MRIIEKKRGKTKEKLTLSDKFLLFLMRLLSTQEWKNKYWTLSDRAKLCTYFFYDFLWSSGSNRKYLFSFVFSSDRRSKVRKSCRITLSIVLKWYEILEAFCIESEPCSITFFATDFRELLLRRDCHKGKINLMGVISTGARKGGMERSLCIRFIDFGYRLHSKWQIEFILQKRKYHGRHVHRNEYDVFPGNLRYHHE